MARVDSLLSILVQQGADELRLGSDQEPKLFANGVPKRLSLPMTPDDTLRELLGELLTESREQALQQRGPVDFGYVAASLGAFRVRLSRRAAGGIEAVFRRERATSGLSRLEHLAPTETPTPGLSRLEHFAPMGVATTALSQTDSLASAGTAIAENVRGLPSAGTAIAENVRGLPSAGTAVAERVRGIAEVPSTEMGALQDSAQSANRFVSSMLAHLVSTGFAARASDIHLADGKVPKLRVDGILRPLGHEPVDVEEALPLISAEKESLAQGRGLDRGMNVADIGRLRVHIFGTAEGTAAAIRLLATQAPSLSSLGLPVALDDVVELPHGLVVVCGATGSGKSTTLAALAQEALRRRSIVLVSLEEPIEYPLQASSSSVVHRRQIGRDVPTPAAGLRDALREDPDVILIGEMRDPETIGLALTAAETGHLVLSSLHSGSAASAIERIVDAYPPERHLQARVQLADALRVVVAQRLLPRANGTGRTAAVEVLRVTHAVGALIREGKTAQLSTAIQAGKREGMLALEKCLADKVRAGEIALEDARRAANQAESLTMYLAR